jgi:hypothetical protein
MGGRSPGLTSCQLSSGVSYNSKDAIKHCIVAAVPRSPFSALSTQLELYIVLMCGKNNLELV